MKQASNDADGARDSENALTTVTHARIRIQQGDLATARRILQAILESQPQHSEAGALLDGLNRPSPSKPAKTEGSSPRREEIEAGDPDAPEIVVERLSRWLDRIKHNAGEGGV